jgi:hypothetical protein
VKTPAAAKEPAPLAQAPAIALSEPASTPTADEEEARRRSTPPSDVRYAYLKPPDPPAQPLGAVPTHPAAIPASARLHYDVQASYHGLPIGGHAVLDWRNDGNRYDARLEVSSPVLATRVQRSEGIVTSEGLQPLRFSDKARTEEATHFQRDKGRITFSSNKPDADLLPGAQDKLSVVIQLCAMIGGDPARYPPGTSIAIPTAGTRESDTWVFTVEGEEDLDLPAGHLRGLKLQRVPRREYDVEVEVWLAPRLDYAPVRIRLTNPNGDSVDQRWSSTDKG